MCDNISTVSILKNPMFHGWTKHIKIKYHFIREVQQSNEVLLVHCSSENQLVDIFTKPLPMERFEAFKHKIGVCHPDAKEECLVVGIPDSKPWRLSLCWRLAQVYYDFVCFKFQKQV